jgi:formate hydrogenlyase transcriptional activator
MRHGGDEGAAGNSRGEQSPSLSHDTKLQLEARACAKGLSSEDILDAIPHSIAVLDLQGTAIYANQGFLDYTGLSLEEIMAPTLRARVFHPDDVARVQQGRAEGLSRGLPFENEQRALGKDGKYRWFLIRYIPACDEHGRVLHWYATGTDIEDRKQAEERLRQDERELRQLIDFLPQHVLVLDKDGTLLQANQTMLDYTGRSLQEMQGAGTSERIKRDLHPDDLERVQSERRAGISNGVPFEIEKRVLGKDGQFRWFLFRYKPVLDEGGRIVRWFATATDIEDRKQAEHRMRNENLALREEIDRSSMYEAIVGSSAALSRVLAQIDKVAPTDSTVLISGETGTGKELIANAIHKRSRRAAKAFIRVNCAAIPPSLIAAELFGHEKGAFTGALQRRAGRFESADGGTIFLDEIGDLPAETQIALLRVLQEREFERVGSSQPISADVRVIAATNGDLEAGVDAGTFRRDLFYRLNVFPIHVPSLRERKDDIPLLVEYLVERYSKRAGKRISHIKKKTLDLLQAYDWPGNIRELQNVVERAVILCDGDTFSVEETWLQGKSNHVSGRPALHAGVLADDKKEFAERERKAIEAALAESRGRVSGPLGAAAKLGIPHQTLESKIASLGIDKHRFKRPGA